MILRIGTLNSTHAPGQTTQIRVQMSKVKISAQQKFRNL